MATKMIGESSEVKDLLKLIGKVGPTNTNILIIGESGTGKELVARMIHESGPLKDKPFVPVNCGAIPENLIESELFGHKRGSFTGAVSDKPGLFEVANGGSLFLDEVGELPLSMQVKLLRALQEKSIRKVGGTENTRVDARIIAATNRDLEAAVAKGTFREDLYYRLNVILIKTPSLRERKGDVTILANHFLKKGSARYKKTLVGFSPEALEALESYTWPGNVRELENVVERAVALETAADIVSLEHLPPALAQARSARASGSAASAETTLGEIRLPAADFSKGVLRLDEILAQVEKTYLLAALEHAGGVKKKAAELLGITFRSMRYRLAKAGLGSDDSED